MAMSPASAAGVLECLRTKDAEAIQLVGRPQVVGPSVYSGRKVIVLLPVGSYRYIP
jgi:hypothetical protein